MDDATLGGTARVGTLTRRPSRGGDTIDFQYAPAWLDKAAEVKSFQLDPQLPLHPGLHRARTGAGELTGAFADCSPDRWGRKLMDRREVMAAREHQRKKAACTDLRRVRLQWQDEETLQFIRYWFGDQQRRDLTRIAAAFDRRRKSIRSESRRSALDVLQVALSRITATKEQCASLARDTSHSRPHRVTLESSYDVLEGFRRSAAQLMTRLSANQAAN